MIPKELRDWLTAAAQGLPRARSARIKKAADELSAATPGARWEVGVISGATCAEGRVVLRLRGLDGRTVETLNCDLRADEVSRADAKPVTAAPFDPSALGEAGSFLADFAAMCPVESMLVEKGGTRWGLKLSRPEPWPGFARLNVADPFSADGTRLAYLMGDRRVRELWYDGGVVTAFLGA